MTVSEFINKVGFKVKDEDVKKVNSTISDIKKTATKVLGVIGIGFSLVSMKNLIEEFGQVNNQINYATGGLEQGAEAQKKILEAANNCRGTYSEIASYATNLANANSSLFPIDEAAKFVEYTTKLGKAAGYTDSVISSTNNTLNKVVASGQMGSAELKNLSENAPAVLNTISNRLGVTKQQLESMAAAGTLSAKTIKEAMMNSAGEIDDAFSNVNLTITDVLKNIRNQWGQWLAESDQMLGLTTTIAKTMQSGFNRVMSVLNKLRTGVEWLSQKLGGTGNLLKMIGIIGGSILVVMKYQKIITFLQTVKTLIMGVRAGTLKTLAIIILLALLVDDFINFMKGNKSVLGTILEKAGVDTEKFRENIIKIWEKAKIVLAAIWQGIKAIAVPIFMGIWEVLKSVFGFIWDMLKALIPDLANMTDELAAGKVDTKKWEKVGKVIGVLGTIILGIIVTLKVVSGVMAIVNAVMAASPITWIIVAIVALIAIIVLCVKHWDKIKEAASKAWEWIKNVWKSVANWFNEKIIQPIVNFFKGLWDGIVGIFKGIIDWVKKNWKSIVLFILNPFAGIFKYLYDNFEGFRNFVNNIVNKIKEFFVGLWNGIVSVFKSVGSFFADIFGGAWEGIKAIWNTVIGWFKAIWDGIVAIFSVVTSWFSDLFSNAWEGIKTAFSTVAEFFQGIWNNIKNAFSSVITWFSNIFQQAWQGIKNVFSAVGGFFKGVWDSIVGIFGKIGTAVGDKISGAVKGAINAVVSGAAKIINVFIKGINAAIGLINKIPGVNIKKVSELQVPKLAEGGYVDANKPQHVIIGDNKREGEIVSPVSKMRETFLEAMNMFIASAKPRPESARSVSNSTSTRSVVQNVNINNEFNGDKAIQQEASKTMDKSADDITAQLARGIAFAG